MAGGGGALFKMKGGAFSSRGTNDLHRGNMRNE